MFHASLPLRPWTFFYVSHFFHQIYTDTQKESQEKVPDHQTGIGHIYRGLIVEHSRMASNAMSHIE